ncbi:phenylalanine--tRNA ligase subunit beta [Candidatus Babeliales bacterium]|nr:phenylalanine--tRNA ligase subunit beta [Candidatus Babeliales bacterium]
MKILLSWLIDHLDTTITNINVENLVHLFNIRTAEIEAFTKLTFDPSRFFMLQITNINNELETFCPELNEKIIAPKRTDATTNKHYLAVRDGKNWRWATLQDFGAEKEGLMPAMHASDSESKGSWKKNIPTIDYVLEIDNKSINHRPDLWGHYGIAREVAAFLNITLKSLKPGLQNLAITNSSKQFSIKLEAEPACTRVAGIFCSNVTAQDSAPWIAIRLAQIDSKPMNLAVDLTNYVMFDIGHPMHVFDATAFQNNQMIVRMADKNEKLELLDGQNVSLESTDVVIANQTSAVSLVGIMGGKNSGWSANSKNIILEAAGLDPLVIRKTAQRLKLRSEASMRFEKHLDPMQNIIALQRFLFLALKLKLITEINESIVSVGKIIEPKSCKLSHEFAEKMLGSQISHDFVQKTLTKLGFSATYDAKSNSYTVIIPTNRMTKDINIEQDLVEEIIRSYGFENITAKLPDRQTQPFNTQSMRNIDHIKRHLAFALRMHEVRDYLLYDAAFITRLQLDLSQAIHVKNPMSQNWVTLTTSLIPHLLKSVETNIVGHDHLRFFESNRTWHTANQKFIEQKTLSGIIFDKKSIDFYSAKSELSSLFDMLKLDVSWQKPTSPIPAWFDVHQVAQLHANGKFLGFAGIMSTSWMHKIAQGSAFIFELNSTLLEDHSIAQHRFASWSKFQEVSYDISVLVPTTLTFETIQTTILKSHPFIKNVKLVDFFEKAEWPDQRAMTLRYTISNSEKTMTKTELDEVVNCVHQSMELHVAKIR